MEPGGLPEFEEKGEIPKRPRQLECAARPPEKEERHKEKTSEICRESYLSISLSKLVHMCGEDRAAFVLHQHS